MLFQPHLVLFERDNRVAPIAFLIGNILNVFKHGLCRQSKLLHCIIRSSYLPAIPRDNTQVWLFHLARFPLRFPFPFSSGLSTCPVCERRTAATSSGVPLATTRPPFAPPSGPRSMMKSARSEEHTSEL